MISLFLNVSAIYNDYDFSFEGGQADFSVDVASGVRDYNFKLDFDYFPNPNSQHQVWGTLYLSQVDSECCECHQWRRDVLQCNLEAKYAHESGIYLLDDWRVSDRLSINAGLSIFHLHATWALHIPDRRTVNMIKANR